MTFHTRGEVDMLVEGLEVLRLREEEADGVAFSGPKHWHVYHLIARRRDLQAATKPRPSPATSAGPSR